MGTIDRRLNADDPRVAALGRSPGRGVTYGIEKPAFLWPNRLKTGERLARV
jgi:hypothetical protein